MDAKRCVLHREAKWPRDATFDRIARPSWVEQNRAAGEVGGIEPAEYDGCIGDRGFLSAAAVAGWPGLGTGGMRTDAQTAGAIEPCDRTTAGANRVHIHHRDTHWKACDAALRANDRLAAFHQRDVTGCAADIDGDELAISR